MTVVVTVTVVGSYDGSCDDSCDDGCADGCGDKVCPGRSDINHTSEFQPFGLNDFNLCSTSFFELI